MKIKSNSELLVKSFVQSVSSATTFSKRYKKVCGLLDGRPELTEQQWLYVWRGMYYSVWYSEMNKGCDHLIERIGGYEEKAMLLSGFKALTNDWFGIDVFRLDKYMFLVRVMINTCLKLQINDLLNNTSKHLNESVDENEDKSEGEVVAEVPEKVAEEEDVLKDSDNLKKKKNKLSKTSDKRKDKLKKEIVFPIEMNAKIVDNVLMIIKSSIGLTLHVTDIFVDELAKVINEFGLKLKGGQKCELYYDILLSCVKLMAVNEDYRVIKNIKENIFDRFKNEILISESIENRKLFLQKFINGMLTIGGIETICRKNRDSIYSVVDVFKTKLNQLNTKNEKKGLKRKKIVVQNGRQKKIKYELTSNSPFVTSIVPIAVV